MADLCFIDFIDEGWMHFRHVDQLIYDVLYADFGVPPDGNWRQPHERTVQVAAKCGFKVAGTACLVGDEGSERLQLRQVAVLPDYQRTGVGRALVEELEKHAKATGTREVWLNAREEAFEFYLRLGYEYTGGTFVSQLTQIPHRPMRKRL